MNELLADELDSKLLKNMQVLFDLDTAELYKTVIVHHNGKPVGSGCLNITLAPIKSNTGITQEYECCEQELQSMYEEMFG